MNIEEKSKEMHYIFIQEEIHRQIKSLIMMGDKNQEKCNAFNYYLIFVVNSEFIIHPTRRSTIAIKN